MNRDDLRTDHRPFWKVISKVSDRRDMLRELRRDTRALRKGSRGEGKGIVGYPR